MMTTLMNPFLAGLVVAGLIAAVFGTVAASTIGSAALLLKDFYNPIFNKDVLTRNRCGLPELQQLLWD